MLKDKDIIYKEIFEERYFYDIEDIQRDSWKMPETALVPQRLFKATQRSGAMVIGAFDQEDLVGYVWGWVGKTEEYGLFIYSHHNAVRKAYQGRGIGYKLKLIQRDWALDRGYRLINWTFDPLQAKNCYINFHKLGAKCNTYKPNYWGVMGDAENKGLETDRLYCNWFISDSDVKTRLDHSFPDYTKTFLKKENHALVTDHPQDFLEIVDTKPSLSSDIIFIEIPPNINEIKKENINLAVKWREGVRMLFVKYLNEGYTAVDFVLKKHETGKSCYHVLQK